MVQPSQAIQNLGFKESCYNYEGHMIGIGRM